MRKAKQIAARAGRAILRHLPKILFWAVVLGLTVQLYRLAAAYSYRVRGYEAIGGEIFIFLLPLGVYALKRWIVGLLKRRDRREPIDADYIHVVDVSVSVEELTSAADELSGVIVTIGVKSEELTKALEMLRAVGRASYGEKSL